MLFSGNEVSVILDFDRSQYGFRLHDVGRAILSFALKDGKMDLKKAYAFLEGYGEWMAFGGSSRAGCSGDWLERTLSDALMLTWCIEAPWWVKKGVFAGASVKTGRFLEEITWVGVWWTYWKCWDSGLKKGMGRDILQGKFHGYNSCPLFQL